MKKILSRLWIIIPPLLLVGLLLSTDADVSGVQGLGSPGVILPGMVLALPLIFLAWGIQQAYTPQRVWKLFYVLIGFSVNSSIIIGLAGSTANTFLTIIWSYFGIFFLVTITLIITVLPAVLVKHAALKNNVKGDPA